MCGHVFAMCYKNDFMCYDLLPIVKLKQLEEENRAKVKSDLTVAVKYLILILIVTTKLYGT